MLVARHYMQKHIFCQALVNYMVLGLLSRVWWEDFPNTFVFNLLYLFVCQYSEVVY